MIREICIAHTDNLTFSIPKKYVGRRWEIIAFPLRKEIVKKESKKKSVNFTDFGISLPSNFKFDSDETNAR